MTVFSLELNKDFKILNKAAYFNEKDFLKLCKSNSLAIKKDELAKYELENKSIKVNPNNFPLAALQYEYSIKDLIKYIESEYHFSGLNEEKSLYSEWLLFYIAIQKFSFLYTSKNEFENIYHFSKNLLPLDTKIILEKHLITIHLY